MNKKIIITALLVLVALAGQAQETVWNNVVAGYNNTQRTVSVTKVDFQADRTDVVIHIDYVAGQWIRIAKDTYLEADGKQYPVKDATVIQLAATSHFATFIWHANSIGPSTSSANPFPMLPSK